jgi:hypothetical protein
MQMKKRRRLLITMSTGLILAGLFLLFGAYSLAWQATSGTNYGSGYVISRQHSSHICLWAGGFLLFSGFVTGGYACLYRRGENNQT